MGMVLYGALDGLLVAGFTAFGPKYLENQFHMDASLASIIFGKSLPVLSEFASVEMCVHILRGLTPVRHLAENCSPNKEFLHLMLTLSSKSEAVSLACFWVSLCAKR